MTFFHVQLVDKFALFKNLETWNLHFFYINNSFIFRKTSFAISYEIAPYNKDYTGCPVNCYSLSISIPDFPDGPVKKS